MRVTTVAQFLASLPRERREVIQTVRKVIRGNLPPGYREAVGWGMITYEVPLKRYPDTYNGKPLPYVCLAAHKAHFALHLMGVYQSRVQAAKLKAAFAVAGKRLNMGKSCVRFKTAEDLPLVAIGRLVAATSVDAFIKQYEMSWR